MNNKGQAVFAGIMIALTVFIVLVQLITPIKDTITEARDVDHLDCENSSITTGVKGTCVIVDIMLPYFFGMGLAAGIAYIGGKKTYDFLSGGTG